MMRLPQLGQASAAGAGSGRAYSRYTALPPETPPPAGPPAQRSKGGRLRVALHRGGLEELQAGGAPRAGGERSELPAGVHWRQAGS